MNRQSIFFTITVSFIISVLLVLLSFAILITHNYKKEEAGLIKKYSPIAKKIFNRHHKGGINLKFAERLQDFNFKMFTDTGSINAITYNPQTKVVLERKQKSTTYRILRLNNYNYLYFKKKDTTILVKDNEEANESSSIYIILVFIIIIITMILLFLITLRKLMPLKILKDKVKTLGEENFDFECCDTNRKDEVSLLALEFKQAATKLKDVKEARNVFIRNIMHELKTPITKGKFLTELERNEANDKKLKEVFIRLEALINEFASIEELISSTKNIEKNFYFLDDIVDNAKDILMLEEEEVASKYENQKIEVNYKLFSIAVKNLMDNAIKYSSNKQVTIKNENEDIIFENEGEKLKYDLEKYYVPFFANEEKIQDSFGLGLYIVNSILKANNYTLEYEYKDGINIFKCKKD